MSARGRLNVAIAWAIAGPSACSAGPHTPAPPAVAEASRAHAGETLHVYGESLETGRHSEQALVARFEADTGIRVQVIPRPETPNETYRIYQRELRAQPPAIDVFLLDVIWPGSFAPALLDLGPALGEQAKADFPMLVKNNTVKGRLVAMPLFVDVGVLLYRTDLLRQAGFSRPPATWDELERMARAVQRLERPSNPGFYGFVWAGAPREALTCTAVEWQVSQGGHPILDPQSGAVADDDPPSIAAFRRAAGWIGTISPPNVTTYGENDSLVCFKAGDAGFLRAWPITYRRLQAPDSAVRGRVGLCRLPHGRGPSVGTLGGWQLGVAARTPHRAAALAFVRYMSSPAVQAWRARIDGDLPADAALYRQPTLQRDFPNLRILEAALHAAAIRPSTRAGARYNELSRIYADYLGQILMGKDPTFVAGELQTDLTRLMQSAGGH